MTPVGAIRTLDLTDETGEPVVEFRILGPLEVIHDGRPLPLRGSRERTVLGVLLMSANHVVSVERIADELWGGHPADGAGRAVRVFVSRLRKALRQPGTEEVIVTQPPGYVARVAPTALDASRFEALVAEARDRAQRGDHRRAAHALREALALWRGPALVDVADGPATRGEAARLEEARLTALEERIDADLALGRQVEVVAELEALTRAHPLRERLWAQRMVALYRCGRQPDALRAYQEVRGILGEELGLEPSGALSRLEGAILRREPELDAPPAGTDGRRPSDPEVVTFLFSDIESSTRRWEGDPSAMATDLALHDELLRAALEAAGGDVFSHTGDGLCAAFATPVAAFDAAVAGQRALQSAAWSSRPGLRVRTAIHVGAVERRADNYFGPPLNRAARLLAVGSGGQTLCSQAAADLVGSDLPPEVTLVDLGEHRLADLAQPERVFQVTHPELPGTFPPLRSLARIRHNLPVALSAFVGRAVELAQLEELLKRSRLVTLLGVGGAGKTRLAVEVASAALDRFPDGVWFVDLAPVRDEALVTPTLAGALRLATDGLCGAERVLEQVCSSLQGKQALFVFDNCEHLIWPTARVVHALLAACPDVTVIATSRETLGLPGEVAWRVPPLSLPAAEPADPADLAGSDAVWLFLERVRAARGDFELTPGNIVAVARICRRLDGIPLAIELAAARTRLLSVERIAAGLDDCFRLLSSGPRTAVARHQTLRAMLDWSYQLLDPGEQALLRTLAVFPADFGLDAAAAVGPSAAEDGADAIDLMARLVDKSMVVVVDHGVELRYRLLEPVRQYAADKLSAAAGTATARRRHHDHYLALVDSWQGTDTTNLNWPLREVAAEVENLRVALGWAWSEGDIPAALRLAGAQSQFWLWGGHFEGCEWTERVVNEARRRGIGVPVQVLAALAYLLATFGKATPEVCETLLEEAVAVARKQEPAAVATAEWALGAFRLMLGKVDQARRLLETAGAEFERIGDPEGLGWCHHELGWLELAGGDLDAARPHFQAAVELADRGRLGQWLTPHVLAGAAPIVALDDPETARHLALRAVDHARSLPTPMILAMTLARAAEVAVVSRRPEEAASTLRELLGLLRDLHARRWAGDALELVGVLAAAEDRTAEAARFFGTSAALREVLGESLGGVRVVADDIRRCRARLEDSLGPERFAAEEDVGRAWSSDEAVAEALAGLADC